MAWVRLSSRRAGRHEPGRPVGSDSLGSLVAEVGGSEITSRPKRLTLPLLIAATVLGLVSCTPPDQGSEPLEPPEPVVSETARTPSPAPSAADPSGVARDVVVLRCDVKAGAAVASGTVVNTASRTADFAITISWLPPNSADPIAMESTTVPAVKRAATVSWSLTTTLPDRAARCSVIARRGELR